MFGILLRGWRKYLTVPLGVLLTLNFAFCLYFNLRYPNPKWDWSKIRTDDIAFPQNFLWGAATSAYQIEGGLTKNTWYRWERTPKEHGYPRIARGETAGMAANHYKLYREDVKLMQDFGLNAYRFSIEWSRIEPEEGKFDLAAIEHYRDLIRRLRAANIEPMIALHHFTDPLWFADKGGFEKEENLQYWYRYANRLFNEYQDEVVYWGTFNELNLYPVSSYLEGGLPPGKHDFALSCRVAKHMLMAHVTTYENFKKGSRSKKHQVGAILSVLEARPHNSWALLDWIVADYEEQIWMGGMLDFFKTGRYAVSLPFKGEYSYENRDGIRAMDFFGVNYYTRATVYFNPFSASFYDRGQLSGFPKTDMDWAIYPEGLLYAIKKISTIGVPMIVTEVGLADGDDSRRGDFIRRHIYALSVALKEGYEVRGFYYWSLLDNFEWLEGFDKRFGLYRVDYKTFKRTLNPGSREYQKVIRRFSRKS